MDNGQVLKHPQTFKCDLILGIRKYVRRQRLPQNGDIFPMHHGKKVDNPRVIQITWNKKCYRLNLAYM